MKKATGLSIIIGIIILLLIALTLPRYEHSLNFFDFKWVLIYSTLLSVLYFLFGILIETERIIKIYSMKVLRVNWSLLGFVVILLSLVFVPIPYWLATFPHNFFFVFITRVEVQVIFSVLAGILFVRAFDKGN